MGARHFTFNGQNMSNQSDNAWHFYYFTGDKWVKGNIDVAKGNKPRLKGNKHKAEGNKSQSKGNKRKNLPE